MTLRRTSVFWAMPVLMLVGAANISVAISGDELKIDCANATATAELNACADKEFDAADAALNKAYAEAIKAIPEMAGEPPYDAKAWEAALRASQRAWVTFRDAECNDHVAMFWTGGSGASADIIGCKTEMTKARTKELDARYKAE